MLAMGKQKWRLSVVTWYHAACHLFLKDPDGQPERGSECEPLKIPQENKIYVLNSI